MIHNGKEQLSSTVLFWLEQIKLSDIAWIPGGIFPREMALFLGFCQHYHIETIIESGRQHAYSTQILGLFAQKTSCKVISVDLDRDRRIAKGARQRMKRFKEVRLLRGDSQKLLSRIMPGLRPPMGLLIDGPKCEIANALSASLSERFDVGVVAHHNCDAESSWGKQFKSQFMNAWYFEDMVGHENMPETLGTWERSYVGPDGGGRTLGKTSLAVALPQKIARPRALSIKASREGPMTRIIHKAVHWILRTQTRNRKR